LRRGLPRVLHFRSAPVVAPLAAPFAALGPVGLGVVAPLAALAIW